MSFLERAKDIESKLTAHLSLGQLTENTPILSTAIRQLEKSTSAQNALPEISFGDGCVTPLPQGSDKTPRSGEAGQDEVVKPLS